MTINRWALATAAAAAVVVTAPASGQSASATIEKAIAAWGRINTFSGTFEQSLQNPLLHKTSIAHGEFRQQRPNKLAIRFTDPAGDAIISDGTWLWIYLKQAAPGQVIKRPASDRSEVPIDISQLLDAAAARFDAVAEGSEPVGTRAARRIGLTPKAGTHASFTHATVWVDDADGLVRQFEVTEPSGLVRRITLTRVAINPAIDPSEFRFVVPQGVKIVSGERQ
ncbi:MAG TPA: outer membrane lipoprotein carrier protein LolA [Gemmatimonadaceae bacterium]|jgi:outer membrane lipoprotein-sorting protein